MTTDPMHATGETDLIIAIPTTARTIAGEPAGYLSRTVRSALSKLSLHERRRVQLVILNCEFPPEAHVELRQLTKELSREDVACHVLERRGRTIETDDVLAWVDATGRSASKMTWQWQLGLDFIELLKVAKTFDSRYILRLEDDVIATDSFLAQFQHWAGRAERRAKTPPYLSFFSPDFGFDGSSKKYYWYSQALLFWNDARLEAILSYLISSLGPTSNGVDALLGAYRAPDGVPGSVIFPSLFQHIGHESSQGPRARRGTPLKSPTFREHHDPWSVLRHKAAQPHRCARFFIRHVVFRLGESLSLIAGRDEPR